MWKKAVAVHANKARTRRKKEDDWRSMMMERVGLCGGEWRAGRRTGQQRAGVGTHGIILRGCLGQVGVSTQRKGPVNCPACRLAFPGRGLLASSLAE
jgi:hypothetical protein